MDIKELFESRRSAQNFDAGHDIDEAVIHEIFELARLAPSSFNLQPWKILLVHDPEQKTKLRKCAMDQYKVTQAPYIAVLLGDKNAYQKMDPILDDFIAKGYFPAEAREGIKGMAASLYGGRGDAFAGRNVGLFAMAFMLAAKSLGVDTHPMDGFDGEAIRREFNVPEDYDVVMLIAIGKHDESKPLNERPARRGFDDVVVRESF